MVTELTGQIGTKPDAETSITSLGHFSNILSGQEKMSNLDKLARPVISQIHHEAKHLKPESIFPKVEPDS
jgi:hypothetical protein